jgi:hypothetical protein
VRRPSIAIIIWGFGAGEVVCLMTGDRASSQPMAYGATSRTTHIDGGGGGLGAITRHQKGGALLQHSNPRVPALHDCVT